MGKTPDRDREPVGRARSGMIGRRFPRTGTEPVTAQSSLGLRLLLAGIFVPVFIAAAYSSAWGRRTLILVTALDKARSSSSPSRAGFLLFWR
ncbi:hypothetical protein [Streptomyces sp. bgisy027]|uniref:hypothetical protein n=1 Tax=Streptomyces sp. bgisy027 TaxID=3413770 RepID=UPI003D7634A0